MRRNRPALAALLLVAILVGSSLVVAPGLPSARATLSPPALTPSAATVVTGNITGPSAVATNGSGNFTIRATGGPAVLGGSLVGTLSWYAKVIGATTTNVSLAPTHGTLTLTSPGRVVLAVAAVVETVTLSVEITSVYGTQNQSLNLTRNVPIVVPFVLSAKLVAGPYVSLLPFSVTIALDGTFVANAVIPALASNATYTFTYRYATSGFSPGWHTFTITISKASGLVSFSGGGTRFSESFYVPGPPPNYALWYLVGIVAFFGALFILVTRVAARRRGVARR